MQQGGRRLHAFCFELSGLLVLLFFDHFVGKDLRSLIWWILGSFRSLHSTRENISFKAYLGIANFMKIN